MKIKHTVDNNEASEMARVRWQCRRGMLELDMLLLSFFDSEYASLAQTERQSFIDLLNNPDPVLYQWLIGKDTPTSPTLAALVETIRKHSWSG